MEEVLLLRMKMSFSAPNAAPVYGGEIFADDNSSGMKKVQLYE